MFMGTELERTTIPIEIFHLTLKIVCTNQRWLEKACEFRPRRDFAVMNTNPNKHCQTGADSNLTYNGWLDLEFQYFWILGTSLGSFE